MEKNAGSMEERLGKIKFFGIIRRMAKKERNTFSGQLSALYWKPKWSIQTVVRKTADGMKKIHGKQTGKRGNQKQNFSVF